jgi:hypothetical protein
MATILEDLLEPEFEQTDQLFKISFDFGLDKLIACSPARVTMKDATNNLVYDQMLEASVMNSGPFWISRAWCMDKPGAPVQITIAFKNGAVFSHTFEELDAIQIG